MFYVVCRNLNSSSPHWNIMTYAPRSREDALALCEEYRKSSFARDWEYSIRRG